MVHLPNCACVRQILGCEKGIQTQLCYVVRPVEQNLGGLILGCIEADMNHYC